MTIGIRLVNRPLYEVIPAKHLLSPQLEGIEEVEIGTVGQSHFGLTVFDPPLNCLVVIVNSRVGDEIVDSIHLHGDFLAYWDFASNHLFSELTVVFGDRSV